MAHFNENLIRIGDRDSLMEFLRQPTLELAEGLTAILASPGQLKMAAGHIVQAAIKGRMYEQIGRELEELKKAGRIKEDFFDTHKQQATLHELLKFIDENPPDDEMFAALKSIFFSTISVDADAEEEQLGYHLLQLCKQLSSGEILVLRTTWHLYNMTLGKTESPRLPQWIDMVAKGAQIPLALLEVYQEKLIQLRLLQGIGATTNDFRLTDLSKTLCDRITKFQ
jgi:hypothetical protein